MSDDTKTDRGPLEGDQRTPRPSLVGSAVACAVSAAQRRARGVTPVQAPESLDLACIASPTVVGQVRLMLDLRLTEWGLSAPGYAETRSDLHLIAAELVTNAGEQTPDKPIRVTCLPDVAARVIRFAVWDSSEGRPQAVMPALTLETLDLNEENFDANGGWGLPLVQALSESCGFTPTGDGKWVWAEIRVNG
jgi:Histidine kinase-like ATPase domain